jgi:transposase
VVRPVREAGIAGVVGQAQVWTTPDSLSAAQRVLLIGLACRPPQEAGSGPLPAWSQTDLRDAFGRQPWGEPVGVRTGGRILQAAQLQPHRQLYWCTSRDPRYDEKLLDVVRLYLEPPAGASVLSIDIKTCIQALGRKHPDIPMQPGAPVRRDFEYVRHGIVDLFASFNVRTGQVLGGTFDRHRHEEFIEFMEQVAFHHRQGEVHCVLDNGSYYTHPEVRDWLSHHQRFVFHFTPTHASWLNQIECWFSILGRKLLRRSSFNSKDELRAAIAAFIAYWNAQAHPFNWAYGEELLHDQQLAA